MFKYKINGNCAFNPPVVYINIYKEESLAHFFIEFGMVNSTKYNRYCLFTR